MVRKLALVLYYSFAKNLPLSRRLGGLPGKIRRSLAGRMFKHMGHHCNIEKGAYFGGGQHISLGDYSGLGINCLISGQYELEVGKYVMMGPDVIIYTQNHDTSRTDIPMFEQHEIKGGKVTIEDDVWIGARVIILPGITIRKGTIVAAGAIVTKDTEAYSIVGGNPAKKIKSR